MNEEKIKNFTDLLAWKEAHQCALQIYQLTRDFPIEERFGLTSQIRRAAISVTSNIAEGFGRRTIPDKRQFYYIAGGLISELQSQLLIARDLGYVDPSQTDILYEQTMKGYRTLNGLIASLQS